MTGCRLRDQRRKDAELGDENAMGTFGRTVIGSETDIELGKTLAVGDQVQGRYTGIGTIHKHPAQSVRQSSLAEHGHEIGAANLIFVERRRIVLVDAGQVLNIPPFAQLVQRITDFFKLFNGLRVMLGNTPKIHTLHQIVRTTRTIDPVLDTALW